MYITQNKFQKEFWWCLLWVSKPEWAALFGPGGGICDVCSLRFISGGTPDDLLAASMADEQLSSSFLRTSIGGARDRDVSCCCLTFTSLKLHLDSSTHIRWCYSNGHLDISKNLPNLNNSPEETNKNYNLKSHWTINVTDDKNRGTSFKWRNNLASSN